MIKNHSDVMTSDLRRIANPGLTLLHTIVTYSVGVGDTSIRYNSKYFETGIEILSIRFWVLLWLIFKIELNHDVVSLPIITDHYRSLRVCYSYWYNV